MPPPFNLRDWPHFRVARSVEILDAVEPTPQPARRNVQTPPLQPTDQHRQSTKEDAIQAADAIAVLEERDRGANHDHDFSAEQDLMQQIAAQADIDAERDRDETVRFLDEVHQLRCDQDHDGFGFGT